MELTSHSVLIQCDSDLLLVPLLLSERKLSHCQCGRNMWICLLKPTLVHNKNTSNKLDKSDFIKNKNLCASKDTIKKLEMQLTDLEKIFANYIYLKGYSIYRI